MWSNDTFTLECSHGTKKKKIIHRGGKEEKEGKEVTEEGQWVTQEMKFDVDSCY